jgi:rhodanese-related sulfurtransferase
MIKTITATELATRLKNEKIKIVDIRNADEHNREHIPNAENVHADHINDKLCYTNDDVLVFSCMSGMRTQGCSANLKKLHAKEVLILDGGLNAWKKAGLETIKNEKAPLPIMRQVQVIVGFMVILGVILGLTVCPYLSLISAFFGGGLLFAGITGNCGLAKVLMFLPYNKVNK